MFGGRFKSHGFEVKTFYFNKQHGKIKNGSICITEQHSLTPPSSLDDPIRVYTVEHDQDLKEFYILANAADYVSANDYLDGIEYDATKPVIMFCPSCFCAMDNDPTSFEISPHKHPTNKLYNAKNQDLYDRCVDCGEDYIYLDEVTKLNLLESFVHGSILVK
jgi:hypothetical protein